MATLKGGLCLILILWTAGSRSRSVPTRSPDASVWWDRASNPILEKAFRLRQDGDFRSAESLFLKGFEEAAYHNDSAAAVKFLVSAGGCQIAQFHYQEALSTLLRARKLAEKSGDQQDLPGISLNISSVYTQVWDHSAALRAVEEGLRQVSNRSSDPSFPYLQLQLGRLYSILNDERATSQLSFGIEAARRDPTLGALESSGWDWLGNEYLKNGSLEDAERAFGEAYRQRILFHKDLGYSYGYLGALSYAQGNWKSAEHFVQLGLDQYKRHKLSWPPYSLLRLHGKIERKRGNVQEALRLLEAAAQVATEWRVGVIPSKAALAESNIGTEKDVVREFAQLAAEYAFRTGASEWAEKAFRATELNRAASLRESIALRDVWRDRLPPSYWEKLTRLQAIQLGTGKNRQKAEENRLRLEISEMEVEAGLQFVRNQKENFLPQNSLIHFREGLGESELLLSFLLGEADSFLWAVSREGIHLYRLPGQEQVAAAIRSFREAVRDGAPDTAERGEVLYQQLLGKLNARERGKPKWLFSAEGAVFDIPFAALVPERRGGKPVYLVEGHSLQTIPGAAFLAPNRITTADSASFGDRLQRSKYQPVKWVGPKRPDVFLGVGDPIYNSADSRWDGPRSTPSVDQLNRLPASSSEVIASARTWAQENGGARVLLGNHARKKSFLDELDEAPAVIHLATHVRVPVDHRDQGLIAFGLATPSSKGVRPEYLDTMQVAALNVPDALVVMTGCETGAGDAQKGAGLLGLTRAWLMAGARGVLATTWQVEDSDGRIFSRFYHHLRNQSPAEALRQSQIDMIRSATAYREPSYWAAYQLTGGLR